MLESLSDRYPAHFKENLRKLHVAIARKDNLSAALLVAQSFNLTFETKRYFQQIEQLTKQAGEILRADYDQEQNFFLMLKSFYTHLAFTPNKSDPFASRHSLIDKVIDYRTGIPVTLTIIFCHIARSHGFDVCGVNFPGHFIIRYQPTADRAHFIDPMTGKVLSWQELENLYFTALNDREEEDMPLEAVLPATTKEVVIRLLQNLKAAFIKEDKFHHALSAAEMLVELSPKDPYERKDRGHLIHQLESSHLAIADYEYFIRNCPRDPAAQLLKLQLRHLKAFQSVVLH